LAKKKSHDRGHEPPAPLGFEWDWRKALYNEAKHGVSFIDATTAFDDSNSITRYDEEHSTLEDRWLLIGRAANGRLLVVLHTNGRGDNIRIIGARDVDAFERRTYEEGEEVLP
jgi:uncharacterized protein